MSDKPQTVEEMVDAFYRAHGACVFGVQPMQDLARRIHAREKAVRAECDEDYETLVGLLKRRFPPNADGSLPDYKIEDVLRENERLRSEVDQWKGIATARMKHIGELESGAAAQQEPGGAEAQP